MIRVAAYVLLLGVLCVCPVLAQNERPERAAILFSDELYRLVSGITQEVLIQSVASAGRDMGKNGPNESGSSRAGARREKAAGETSVIMSGNLVLEREGGGLIIRTTGPLDAEELKRVIALYYPDGVITDLTVNVGGCGI